LAALIGLTAVLALLAAGCGGGGSSSGGNVQALPASSCSDIYYQGEGKPDFVIASDLPLQGSGRSQTVQMTEAIKFILKQHDFKAGDTKIGYQSCDDATAQEGAWASEKCSANAQAYAQNKDVLGVLGTFNSGCAEIIVPILNRASNGPIAMISPANTYVGLTHGGPGTAAGEPDKYYPDGKRNYIRIVAADDYQGAADALNTQQLGLKKVYILNDKQAYGLGVATDYQNSMKQIGVPVAGFSAWNSKASSYTGLATQIKQSGADAVFIGGLICENGGKLIKDLGSVLGKNVTLLAPDGFTPISAVVSGAGAAAEGMYVSVAGQPNEKLGPNGQKFVKDFGATQSGGNVDPYSAYAAQAADVLLTAIENSDGTRADVAAQLLNTKVTDGILGSFTINANGDTNSNPVTIYQIKNGKQTTYKTIVPPQSLVKGS
jgi:branched-chain amino acid transport system substrate-binding protein